jgi:hypothetical protein
MRFPSCFGTAPNHTLRMPKRPDKQRLVPRPRPLRTMLAVAIATAALALTGCQAIRGLFPASREDQEAAARLLELQARNMRYADLYVGTLATATRNLDMATGDPRQRYALSGWVLAEANTAYSDASADNAILACLDLVTLATLSRMTVEAVGPDRFPEHAATMVAVHRDLENSAWELAAGILTPIQQSDLRRVLAEWHDKHPDSMVAPFMRFQEFVSETTTTSGKSKGQMPSSLMGLVGLDPMAGLDPAVKQVEQSRLLAERALYYAQRVPIIFDLQLDRSVNRLASGPESQRLQQQTASLTSSAARFAAVAEALPATLSAEREALIRQLNDTLVAQAASLRPLLVDMRGTLEAGSAAAASVDQATRSIDALVARFAKKPGETATGKPFDVNEYTQAAAEISRAAGELDRLVGSAGAQGSRLGTALDAGAAQGRSLVDYFFVRVAWLIGLLCVGLLATLLLYRRLAGRLRSS